MIKEQNKREELERGDSVWGISLREAKTLLERERLLTINSLTQGLKELNAPFEVELLYLGESGLYAEESAAFSSFGALSSDIKKFFAREVLLKLEGTPVVWARSVIDSAAESWLKILDCGTEPLGHKLFDGTLPLSRSAFEYGEISSHHLMFGGKVSLAAQSMIARRSIFSWESAPLLLTECYLPALERFIARC